MENHHAEQNQLSYHDEDKYYDEIVSRLPPGYRFVPEDEELIEKFLKVIIKNPERGRVQGIFTVNLYASSPDELTAAHKPQCEDTWYFFTKRTRKYANGSRPARAAGYGYWKQTNVVDSINYGVDEQKEPVKIGRKITLDYCYKNNGVESRTDWKMNEYRLDGKKSPDDHCSNFDEWSLCRIYKGRGSKQKNKGKQVVLQVEAEPSSGTQAIASEEHNEHFAGEADGNSTGQSTAAASNNQLSIPREQYNGLYAGGPGPSSVQQSTNLQFNNSREWIPNYSHYMANVASGSTNGMHYTSYCLPPEFQENYPVYENAGFVQPLRSLPPNGIPTSSSLDINQNSSSIRDHVTSEEEFGFPFTDVDITFDDFEFEKKNL
ncbi:hypothetical protein ACET3Z_030103 [Daucus carota]